MLASLGTNRQYGTVALFLTLQGYSVARCPINVALPAALQRQSCSSHQGSQLKHSTSNQPKRGRYVLYYMLMAILSSRKCLGGPLAWPSCLAELRLVTLSFLSFQAGETAFVQASNIIERYYVARSLEPVSFEDFGLQERTGLDCWVARGWPTGRGPWLAAIMVSCLTVFLVLIATAGTRAQDVTLEHRILFLNTHEDQASGNTAFIDRIIQGELKPASFGLEAAHQPRPKFLPLHTCIAHALGGRFHEQQRACNTTVNSVLRPNSTLLLHHSHHAPHSQPAHTCV